MGCFWLLNTGCKCTVWMPQWISTQKRQDRSCKQWTQIPSSATTLPQLSWDATHRKMGRKKSGSKKKKKKKDLSFSCSLSMSLSRSLLFQLYWNWLLNRTAKTECSWPKLNNDKVGREQDHTLKRKNKSPLSRVLTPQNTYKTHTSYGPTIGLRSASYKSKNISCAPKGLGNFSSGSVQSLMSACEPDWHCLFLNVS